MDWKIATVGLAAVMGLLIAFSSANLAVGFTGGTMHVSVPEAQLSNVTMYGGAYDGTAPAPVVVQEIGTLSCPDGQVITREMVLPGPITITVSISMDSATLSDALLKASGLTSTSGDLTSVVMTVEDIPKGMQQTIASGTMYNLEADIYFVSMSSLEYQGLNISIS